MSLDKFLQCIVYIFWGHYIFKERVGEGGRESYLERDRELGISKRGKERQRKTGCKLMFVRWYV